MNLANKLTVFRIFCIPIFVVLMFVDFPFHYLSALIVFVVASITDFLDGKIARKNNWVTNFGKFMDPLADKLLVSAALISLIPQFNKYQWIYIVIVIVIISRELFISGFRTLAADQGIVLAAGWSGKVKTATQMVMLIVLIAYSDKELWFIRNDFFKYLGWVLIWASLSLTISSMVDYVKSNINVLKN